MSFLNKLKEYKGIYGMFITIYGLFINYGLKYTFLGNCLMITGIYLMQLRKNELEKLLEKIKQLDSLVDVQKAKVLKLENKLSKTAAEAAKEHKQHEKDLKRISAMSNSDVAALFSESFK